MKKIILFLILMTGFAHGAGFVHAYLDQEVTLKYTSSAVCDSVVSFLIFPDSADYSDTVTLYPDTLRNDSTLMYAAYTPPVSGPIGVFYDVYETSDAGAVSSSGQADLFSEIAPGGAGPFQVDIYVEDDDADFIAGLSIRAQSSGGVDYSLETTDAAGKVTYSWPSGTFYIWVLTTPRYTQDTIPDTVVVAAAVNDTIMVTDEDTDKTGVYGYVYDGAGSPVKNARVTFSIPREYWPVRVGVAAIRARLEPVFTDASGRYDQDLYPNSFIYSQATGDSSSVWHIKGEAKGSTVLDQYVTVPDSANFLIPLGSE